jgi:hypothetical protein
MEHDGGRRLSLALLLTLLVALLASSTSVAQSSHATAAPAVTTGAWHLVSAVGAPSARLAHTAVWTGTEMLTWGGSGPHGLRLNDGARYVPASAAGTHAE